MTAVTDTEVLERFRVFREAVDELWSRRIVATGALNAHFGMSVNESGTTVTVADPDEEDLRSFLIDFRLFTLKKEPVYFRRVLNLCARVIVDDAWRTRIAEARAAWDNAENRGLVKLDVDGVVYTPGRLLGLWINGRYFHRTAPEKRAELERVEALPMVGHLTSQLVLGFAVEGTRLLDYVSAVIEAAAEEGLIDPRGVAAGGATER